MEKYKIVEYSKSIYESGYTQEGYEPILSFKLWISLSKVSLTKKELVYETFDLKRDFTIQEFYDFVDECKRLCMQSIKFNGETYNDYIDLAELICSKDIDVKKDDKELESEYRKYVSQMMRTNSQAFAQYQAKIKADKDEAELFLRLKEKYEGAK